VKGDGKSPTARNEVQLLAALRVLPKKRQLIPIKLLEE